MPRPRHFGDSGEFVVERLVEGVVDRLGLAAEQRKDGESTFDWPTSRGENRDLMASIDGSLVRIFIMAGQRHRG